MEGKILETEMGFSVSGKINFDNVLLLRRQGNRLINRIMLRDITVDLSELKSSDSSGLSLLLRWLRIAGQQGKTMRIINMPEFLHKVAIVCGVASLLGLPAQ